MACRAAFKLGVVAGTPHHRRTLLQVAASSGAQVSFNRGGAGGRPCEPKAQHQGVGPGSDAPRVMTTSARRSAGALKERRTYLRRHCCYARTAVETLEVGHSGCAPSLATGFSGLHASDAHTCRSASRRPRCNPVTQRVLCRQRRCCLVRCQ